MIESFSSGGESSARASASVRGLQSSRGGDMRKEMLHLQASKALPSSYSRRRESWESHSSSPGFNATSPSFSPSSPCDWFLGPDNQSERIGQSDSSDSSACNSSTSRRCHSRGLNFMENLRVIPITPMMENPVDETWDFDFDEGRGGTSDPSSKPRKSATSMFPNLSPRSERQQTTSLFSPVSVPASGCGGQPPRRIMGRSLSSKIIDTTSDSLVYRESPGIQSARGTDANVRNHKNTLLDGDEVEVDAWAKKMIRQHSEPSLRPKCRQSARRFADQACINAGPSHLTATSLDQEVLAPPVSTSLKQNLRKTQANAAVLARMRVRRVSNN